MVLGHFGSVMEHVWRLWGVLGPLGAILGPLGERWGHVYRSGLVSVLMADHLGSVLGQSWGVSGGLLGPLAVSWGLLRSG